MKYGDEHQVGELVYDKLYGLGIIRRIDLTGKSRLTGHNLCDYYIEWFSLGVVRLHGYNSICSYKKKLEVYKNART